MKHIIVAFDGLKFSENAMQCALFIAKAENAHLTGIFLDDFLYNSFNMYQVMYKEKKSKKEIDALQEEDRLERKKATGTFVKACNEHRIEYTVRHDKSIALQELLHESIYADLLILDAAETFSYLSESKPTRFIKDLLAEVRCPVLLTCGHFSGFEKTVLLYDGGPAAVFAAKTFCHTLSSQVKLPTEVITVKHAYDSLHLPDKTLIREFIKRHFPKASFATVKGNAEHKIVMEIQQEKESTLVVLGAYQRGTVSRWFKPSMADVLMEKTNVPLFIAHSK